jgi:hypothetical protein
VWQVRLQGKQREELLVQGLAVRLQQLCDLSFGGATAGYMSQSYICIALSDIVSSYSSCELKVSKQHNLNHIIDSITVNPK